MCFNQISHPPAIKDYYSNNYIAKLADNRYNRYHTIYDVQHKKQPQLMNTYRNKLQNT